MAKAVKNAQLGEKFIVVLVLILIFLVVMLVFQDRVFKLREEGATKDICKASVMKHVMARQWGINFVDDINCPTQRIKIPDSDKEAVKKKVAGAMYDCYDEFLQGKYELFSAQGENNYCVICHVISFDNKMEIPVSEFADYLARTKIEGTNATYQDFFASYTTDTEATKNIIKNTATAQDINTEYDYATVFTYVGRGYTSKLFSTSAGITGGIVAGAVVTVLSGGSALIVGSVAVAAGAAGGFIGYQVGSDKTQDWSSGINLVPYNAEQLRQLGCTELPAVQVPLADK
jgi:hypothetical protein